jgi:hypothetical protein
MFRTKALTALVAALSMMGASTVASATAAVSKLLVAPQVRAGAKLQKANQPSTAGWIGGALVAATAVIGVGVIVLTDDNDTPTSA